MKKPQGSVALESRIHLFSAAALLHNIANDFFVVPIYLRLTALCTALASGHQSWTCAATNVASYVQ